jgi:hypothetical protein
VIPAFLCDAVNREVVPFLSLGFRHSNPFDLRSPEISPSLDGYACEHISHNMIRGHNSFFLTTFITP